MKAKGVEEWWEITQTIAEISLSEDGWLEDSPSLWSIADGRMLAELLKRGFCRHDSLRALTWLQEASNSGRLEEILRTIRRPRSGSRVTSPIENFGVSDNVWSDLLALHAMGRLPEDLMERIIVALRILDTRDWDDAEVRNLIAVTMACLDPAACDKSVRRLVQRRRSQQPH